MPELLDISQKDLDYLSVNILHTLLRLSFSVPVVSFVRSYSLVAQIMIICNNLTTNFNYNLLYRPRTCIYKRNAL